MGNAIIATRLSRNTDASTSIERQTEASTRCAQMRGDTIVTVTEDVDVSGSVAPFERADLGPWLTDPEKITQWDTLIVPKLDRLTRNLRDFDVLREWCDAHGKTIVSVAESLDLSTPIGRMFANLLAMFAQFEKEQIQGRVSDSHVKLKSGGYWGGGKVPFGFRAEESGNHWVLAVDEQKSAVIRDAEAKIMGGWSLRRTAKHHGMVPQKLADILRRESLRGVVTHNGQVVRDESGLPVRHAAILTDDEWLALQAKLDGLSKPHAAGHKDAAMLLGVARCGCCDAPVYLNRRLVRGKPAPNYRHADSQCPRGGQGSFSAHALESAVETELLALVGHVDMVETVTVPGKGDDLRTQIQRVRESVAEIEAAIMDKVMPAASAGRMLTKLEDKLTEYQATLDAMDPDERDGYSRDVATGITYAAHWAGLDSEGRGAFLRANAVKLYVARDAYRMPDVSGPMNALEVPRTALVESGRIRLAINLGGLGKLAEAASAA